MPPQPNVLTRNIGDAILYHSNPIFRAIRDKTIAFKYRFTTRDPMNYFSSPFLALGEIKKRKLLPYLTNINTLYTLEKTRPNIFTLDDVKGMRINFNSSAVHECCHVIASEILMSNSEKSKITSNNKKQKEKEFLLDAMLEEAFADSTELLSSIYNKTEAQKFSAFYNTYIQCSDEENSLLASCLKRYGYFHLAQACIYISLITHFMCKGIDSKDILGLKKLYPENPVFSLKSNIERDRNLLFKLFERRISPFRIKLDEIFFRFNGVSLYKSQIHSLDPIKFMHSLPSKYLISVDEMIRIILVRKSK